MTPFFSIIIPVYNVAPYLRTCLDSVFAAEKVLRQSQDAHVRELGVEVICIDDGSTDGSGGILDDFADQLKQHHVSGLDLKVIHQKNAGLGPARNSGLDRATGDYVLFVDSDDSVTTNWLQCLAMLIKNHAGADCVTFSYRSVTRQDVEVEWNEYSARDYDFGKIGDFREITSRIGSWYSWRLCIRRSCIGTLRYFAIQPGEDILFASGLLPRLNSVTDYGGVLYRYHIRAGSTMKREIKISFLQNAIRVTRMRHEAVRSWERYAEVKDIQLHAMMECFAGGLSNGIARLTSSERKAALKLFWEEGQKIFTEGWSGFVFRRRSRFLFWGSYRLNWRLRVALLKCGWIRRIKDVVRGRR